MKKGTLYRQLSYEERVQIGILQEQGQGIRAIARILSRSPNTIARELREKRVRGVYIPKKARHKTYWRRYISKRNCMKVATDAYLQQFVSEKLLLHWSPERMSGFLKRRGMQVSRKALYKYIRSRCLERKLFWKDALRRKQARSPHISHADSLKRAVSARPSLTGSGHMELDFLVSKQSSVVLLVLVDRYSRITWIRRLEHKTHRAVLGVLRHIHMVAPFKTITTDNDIVFKNWRDMEAALSVPFFFTQPYHSWEKGLVENTNRWIRVYISKKEDLAPVTDDELRSIEFFLNETPRQCLGYRTASEVQYAEKKITRVS